MTSFTSNVIDLLRINAFRSIYYNQCLYSIYTSYDDEIGRKNWFLLSSLLILCNIHQILDFLSSMPLYLKKNGMIILL
jgi:hypothetical protein